MRQSLEGETWQAGETVGTGRRAADPDQGRLGARPLVSLHAVGAGRRPDAAQIAEHALPFVPRAVVGRSGACFAVPLETSQKQKPKRHDRTKDPADRIEPQQVQTDEEDTAARKERIGQRAGEKAAQSRPGLKRAADGIGSAERQQAGPDQGGGDLALQPSDEPLRGGGPPELRGQQPECARQHQPSEQAGGGLHLCRERQAPAGQESPAAVPEPERRIPDDPQEGGAPAGAAAMASRIWRGRSSATSHSGALSSASSRIRRWAGRACSQARRTGSRSIDDAQAGRCGLRALKARRTDGFANPESGAEAGPHVIRPASVCTRIATLSRRRSISTCEI